jgi:hypothetical protein
MIDDFEISQGKSIGDLWTEAAWFVSHTAIAIFAMFAAIALFTLTQPSPVDPGPKLIGTALAFFVPMLVGYLIAWKQKNDVARYVWISGVIIFGILCVWVIDLPTGPGLCEHCLLIERLRRTFFDVSHGSGLLAGWGFMLGTWIPLSLFGYALGAKFGLD